MKLAREEVAVKMPGDKTRCSSYLDAEWNERDLELTWSNPAHSALFCLSLSVALSVSLPFSDYLKVAAGACQQCVHDWLV